MNPERMLALYDEFHHEMNSYVTKTFGVGYNRREKDDFGISMESTVMFGAPSDTGIVKTPDGHTTVKELMEDVKAHADEIRSLLRDVNPPFTHNIVYKGDLLFQATSYEDACSWASQWTESFGDWPEIEAL